MKHKCIISILCFGITAWICRPTASQGITVPDFDGVYCHNETCYPMNENAELPPNIESWGWTEDGEYGFVRPKNWTPVIGEDC